MPCPSQAQTANDTQHTGYGKRRIETRGRGERPTSRRRGGGGEPRPRGCDQRGEYPTSWQFDRRKTGNTWPQPTFIWRKKRRQEEEAAERKEVKTWILPTPPHTDFYRSKTKTLLVTVCCCLMSSRSEFFFSSIWSYVLTFSVAHSAAACQFAEQPSGTQRVTMPSWKCRPSAATCRRGEPRSSSRGRTPCRTMHRC